MREREEISGKRTCGLLQQTASSWHVVNIPSFEWVIFHFFFCMNGIFSGERNKSTPCWHLTNDQCMAFWCLVRLMKNSQHNYLLDVPCCNGNAITCSFCILSELEEREREWKWVVWNGARKHHNFLSIYCSHSPPVSSSYPTMASHRYAQKHASNKQNYIKS